MQVIIISKKPGAHSQWHLNKGLLALLALLLLAGLSAVVVATYHTMQGPVMSRSFEVASKILPLPNNLASSESNTDYDQGPAELTDYYAKRIGVLQAEAIRLKSLMTRLAEEADLDTASFLLSEAPAVGGINDEGVWLTSMDFMAELDKLETTFKQQNEQVGVMQSFSIMNAQLQSSIPAGAPTESGYISSGYGNRIHPISGKKAFHKGMDFAAPSGSKVLAAADGLVIKTERRSGYGMLVEIDHGNGYITRYAHNKTATVKQGDHVKQGQQIATVGSTGKSTGPHVHFEILQDGKSINPYSYVKNN